MSENEKDDDLYNNSDILSGSDSMTNILSEIKINSNVKVFPKTLNIDDIVTSSFKKVSREKTLIGLSGMVGVWGVVSPVHVMELEDENSYLLLDGLRRLFGALRNDLSEVPAMVWSFEDKIEGKQFSNVLSLLINRSQTFSPKEQWEQMKILEEVNDLPPSVIEFCLGLHSGEAMKLKDVMLSDMEYSEIRSNLVDDVFTIEQAYKKLCNERKKENRLAKDDTVAISAGYDNAETVKSDELISRLDVDSVKDLLDLTGRDIDDLSVEEMDRRGEVDISDEVQDVHDRHTLDPKLKESVLIRDNFSCRCCGLGGSQRLAVLAVHHIVQVSDGGPDSMANLVTLCVNCHILVHSTAWGKVHVKLADLSDEERGIFKNIFKYANVIIESAKRLKLTKEQRDKESRASVRHPFPGEGLSDNTKAFENSKVANTSSEG